MTEISSVVHDPFDGELMRDEFHRQYAEGRFVAKVASSALIVNNEGQILIASHKARPNEFVDGALGVIMETYRYTPDQPKADTETPLQVFVRSVKEELKLDRQTFDNAGFYFDRQHPVWHCEWSAGPKKTFTDYLGWVTSIVVRVENGDLLEKCFDDDVEHELKATKFMTIDEVLASREPKREGFDKWLVEAQQQLFRMLPQRLHIPISWFKGPRIGNDVEWPYIQQ